jgi:tRNA-Thr(GGU) m(6)t(6)A37 methyltransferase TsaA
VNQYIYTPIGIVHSPFKEPKNVPIQAAASKDTKGTIEIYPEYIEGLRDLAGFSHIILIYHFHKVTATNLTVKPFLDDQTHGVFATRAPARPNKIGLSVLKLTSVDGNILQVEDLDVLDGTPVLDVKPFVPEFDCRKETSVGWFSDKLHKLSGSRDDGRFCQGNPI